MTSPPLQSISSPGNTRLAQPFFCWVNFTHMHCRTHTKPESLGQAGRRAVSLP